MCIQLINKPLSKPGLHIYRSSVFHMDSHSFFRGHLPIAMWVLSPSVIGSLPCHLPYNCSPTCGREQLSPPQKERGRINWRPTLLKEWLFLTHRAFPNLGMSVGGAFSNSQEGRQNAEKTCFHSTLCAPFPVMFTLPTFINETGVEDWAPN